MGKDFKIWGMSYGLIGDLVMGLPLLTYFEKKYPGSYKYWVIEKKCSISAALYFNHPLIDRIKITDEWGGFGEEDRRLMQDCSVKTINENWKHSDFRWYNSKNCVEETAIIAGVQDLKETLDDQEMKPKLYPWFNIGFPNSKTNTYSKHHELQLDHFDKNIAIWPFASGGEGKDGRSPSKFWWEKMVKMLTDEKYTVYHYGHPSEPSLSNSDLYVHYKHLSYFEQVKASLASKIVIGTDSGSMWVIGAYCHPSIHLMTNWMPEHNKNFMSLEPVNDNGTTFFEKNGCDNISRQNVLDYVMERV